MLQLSVYYRPTLLALVEVHTVAPGSFVLDHVEVIRRESEGPQDTIAKLQYVSLNSQRLLERAAADLFQLPHHLTHLLLLRLVDSQRQSH